MMKLKFLGAAGTVTGSRTLLALPGFNLLIDAGLFQGGKNKRQMNWNNPIEVEKISAIVLTHAHIDHSGFLPKLIHDGYQGPIYSSEGTRDLCDIMLLDAAKLQEEDADYANRSGYSNHKPAFPLYTTDDARNSLKLFKALKRDEWHEIFPDVSLRLIRSGHILGSSYVQVNFNAASGINQTITFSGDVGSGRSRILRPPVPISETDFLVLESTYGDRIQSKMDPLVQLEEFANRVLKRGGVLLIPAFSVGRTQDILHLLRLLEERGKLPKVPVFLDSPMGINATRIFLSHPEDHQLIIENNNLVAPIDTSDFYQVKTAQESKIINNKSGPMIIISSSGMLTGGRIMHHLKSRLPDARNGVLFTGYQAEETKGRLLVDGMNLIRIHHEEIPVRAEMMMLDNLSGHADQNELLDWVGNLTKAPKMIFINHGEKNSSLSLKEKIKERFNYPVTIPEMGESFDLAQWDSI